MGRSEGSERGGGGRGGTNATDERAHGVLFLRDGVKLGPYCSFTAIRYFTRSCPESLIRRDDVPYKMCALWCGGGHGERGGRGTASARSAV